MSGEWVYYATIEVNNRTFHVWELDTPVYQGEQAEYLAYTLTHQPSKDTSISFIQPQGGVGHWHCDSLDSLAASTDFDLAEVGLKPKGYITQMGRRREL